MAKMHTQLQLFKTVLVVGASLMLPISGAHAQAMSSRGVSTGGDTVSAIVPEAGNLFQTIDIVEGLQDAIVACALDGRFVADAGNLAAGCRQGVPPEVEFVRSGGDTYVDVELAAGQARPGNSLVSPKGTNFSRFGGLDGEDGECALAGGGSCPSP